MVSILLPAGLYVCYLVFFVDRTHQRRSWWQNLIDEDEDGLLWGQLDPLADHVDKLADSEIRWNQILLLVDGCDIRFLDFLTYDLRQHISGLRDQERNRK